MSYFRLPFHVQLSMRSAWSMFQLHVSHWMLPSDHTSSTRQSSSVRQLEWCFIYRYIILKSHEKLKNSQRSLWIKDYLKICNIQIMTSLELYNESFTLMSKINFYSLLKIIEPVITKQNTKFSEAIPAKLRLAKTLLYLATVDSSRSLMYLFKVSKQSILAILPQVLKAIIQGFSSFPLSEGVWYKLTYSLLFTSLNNVFYL